MKGSRYANFAEIENESNLAKFFNMVFEKLETFKMISSPDLHAYNDLYSAKGKTSEVVKNASILFYEACLLENYLHSIIEHLTDWKEKAIRYNSEFSGSWRFYAIAEHRDGIKEYGGEDTDYNKDGSIRTDFTDEELKGADIVSQMVDYNHIFLTTKPEHLYLIYNLLLNIGDTNIFKFFENQGIPLSTYSRDENGNMVKNTWADEKCMEAKDQHICDTLAEMLYSVVAEVSGLVVEVEKLKYNSDNKKFFTELPERINAIMDLQISILSLPYKTERS